MKPHWTLGRDRAGFRELDQDVRRSRGYSRSCRTRGVSCEKKSGEWVEERLSNVFYKGRREKGR